MSETAPASPPDFAAFLADLGDALDRRALDGRGLEPRFDPARATPAAAGEVLVGIGNWSQQHQGACLNNKGSAAVFGWKRDPITVSTFVRDAGPDLVAQWQAGFPGSTEAVLERAVLVVEDASPDSVLTLVFWLARLAGVPSSQLPLRWLTALTAWERDGIAPSVTKSWTALMSALAHSHFGSAHDGVGIAEAWDDALRFTVALLRSGADPDAVDPENAPAILADTAYGRAIAFALNERQDYLQSLTRAIRLELLVPMAGAPGRTQLVDAYFATESNTPSGVKKIFIRTDTQNTTLGNGFAMMGLYRPGLEGTGNDMTLSVDPRSGIALKDLWFALDGEETKRWEGKRANANPRRIASYKPGEGYDQPWWDDHGRYTLIGAPKRLGGDTGPGSKLAWGDVLEAVWRHYNQLRVVEALDLNADGRLAKIEDCVARRIERGSGDAAISRYLMSVRWNRSDADGQTLQFTPTVKRHLAAMVVRAGAGKSGAVPLADLAAVEDFDYLELAGGAVIVTREGALLFDDWRDRDLHAQILTADFEQAVDLLAAASAYDGEVDRLYAAGTRGDVLRKVTELRARVVATFQKADLANTTPERRAFRVALEARWGLENKEAQLTGRLKDLQEIVETKATLDTQGMATLLAFVTIPAFIASVLQLYGNVVAAQTDESGVNYAVAMFALLAVLSFVAMIAALVFTRRKN
jgi:hypothetical protein